MRFVRFQPLESVGGPAARRVLALALMIGAAASPAAAQQNKEQIQVEKNGVGTASGEFLLLGAGARGMALGPAASTIARDADALYYNPANLPLLSGREVGLTVMPYIADTRYVWAGVGMPIAGGDYAVGFSFSNFGFSNAPRYSPEDPDGEGGFTYGVSQSVFGFSFAHAFIDRFTGGASLKFINDRLGQTSAFGFAMDIGTNYHAEIGGKPIAFSFVIQNLDVLGLELRHSGPGLDLDADPSTNDPGIPDDGNVDPAEGAVKAAAFPLPTVFRVGLSYDVLSTADRRLTLLTDFNEPYHTTPGFSLGGEFAWSPTDGKFNAALRGSYQYQGDNDFDERRGEDFTPQVDNVASTLDGFSAGGGIGYNMTNYQVRLDYAFRHFGVLGSTNAFSVSLTWK